MVNVSLQSIPGNWANGLTFSGDLDYNSALDISSKSGETISTSWKRLIGLMYSELLC